MQYFGTSRHQRGQSKAVTGASATFTNPIGSFVSRFCLSATLDICFRQGPASGLTAVITDQPIFANGLYYFSCNPGESVAIIARDGVSTGTAYLSEAV